MVDKERGSTAGAGLDFVGLRGRCLCPAKVNLDLFVRGRRDDGYHLLESRMVPIDVGDLLTIEVGAGPTRVDLDVAGRPVPGGRDNLVVRAAEMVLQRAELDLSVQLHLEKRVPVGAGLGGGSSDAAGTLRMMAELLEIAVGADQLAEWALELGADVPFFVAGRPARMSGIGEVLEPLTEWPRDPLVVAFQGAGLSTAEVFARFDASLTSTQPLSSIPVFPKFSDSPRSNDLEAAAIQIDPGVETLKRDLHSHGAREVGMSGSGSAVFGFFANLQLARSCSLQMSEKGVWAVVCQVLGGAPPIERLNRIPN